MPTIDINNNGKWEIKKTEVIKCRYCKYKKRATIHKNGFLVCPVSGMEITDDDFCSYAEIKDDSN